MKIGTASVLYGAHQFMLHPWFVALAWWKLYGFPWDPRLWVAFFVHDLGYFGKPNMDGPEGEYHVMLGAKILGRLFDSKRRYDAPGDLSWYCFSFYHSRFMAKKYGVPFSRLCVADKLAIVLTPSWLYLPLVNLTGEIHEYMDKCKAKEGAKYASMSLYSSDQREWYLNMQDYLRRWVDEHKDGREDTWTPELRQARDNSGVWQ